MVKLTLLVVLALTSACQPSTQIEETRSATVGVITEQDPLGGTRFRISLSTGEVVEFDSNATRPLGSTPFPEPGMLLFLGEDLAWFTAAEPVGDCYEMSGWVGDHDGEAMLGTGLVLEVAPSASGPIGAGAPSEGVVICLDAQGRYVGVCDGLDRGCS